MPARDVGLSYPGHRKSEELTLQQFFPTTKKSSDPEAGETVLPASKVYVFYQHHHYRVEDCSR